MPKLSTAFEKVKFTCPSYEGSEILIRKNLTVGDLMELEKEEKGFEHSVAMLELLIEEWNFNDESGLPLPISRENIKKFPFVDITALLQFVNEFQKKRDLEKTK